MDQFLEYMRYFAFTFFGGILGYLIRIQIEHRLALSRIIKGIEITNYNNSVASFRAAFAPALALIYLTKKQRRIDVSTLPNIEKFLGDALLTYATAVELFRVHVSDNKKEKYQAAWETFRDEVAFGFDTTSLRGDISDPHGMYEKLIHDILAFADN